MDGSTTDEGQRTESRPAEETASPRAIPVSPRAKPAKLIGAENTQLAKASAKKAEAKAVAGPSGKEPKSSPKHVTVKKLTTALKPKSNDNPEADPAATPAAQGEPADAVSPSVTVEAPQADELAGPKPATAKSAAAKTTAKSPATPKSAAAPAPALQPAPAAAPAPAQQSHSGVISGPMRPLTPPRAMAKAEIFVDGDFVVYPTHGVGKVERIATEEIAGHRLELIHITFDENRMTLRVPTNKARTAGLRKLASRKQFDEVLATLKGRARIKRTMWSRRAQEYEAKINSGDPSSIAEVVRDLHRNAGQPDQSFSERQIYESALDRLAAEYAALEQVDKPTAIERLIAHLKSD
jgi:CarD family transcriptional regulator